MAAMKAVVALVLLAQALAAEPSSQAARDCESGVCQTAGTGEHLLIQLQRRSSVSLTSAVALAKPAPKGEDEDEESDSGRRRRDTKGGKGGRVGQEDDEGDDDDDDDNEGDDDDEEESGPKGGKGGKHGGDDGESGRRRRQGSDGRRRRRGGGGGGSPPACPDGTYCPDQGDGSCDVGGGVCSSDACADPSDIWQGVQPGSSGSSCKVECDKMECHGYGRDGGKWICVTPPEGTCVTGVCTKSGSKCKGATCGVAAPQPGEVCFEPCPLTEFQCISHFTVSYGPCPGASSTTPPALESPPTTPAPETTPRTPETAPTTPAPETPTTTPAPATTPETPAPTTTSGGPCHSLLEGEECYDDVLWAMLHGVFSNPEWYPAPLSPASPWEDFQAHFHSFDPERCPMPCPRPEQEPPTGQLCVPSAVKLDFFHSELTHSNFAGLGPDSGAETMVYSRLGNRTVFEGDEELTRPFDLVVSVSGGYRAHKQERNGLSGKYGIVNLASPSSADLTFSFVDTETREPVTLEAFHFSFFDIDQSKKTTESMLVGGFESYEVDAETEVSVEEVNGKTLFRSTKIGKLCDNPRDPMELGVVTCEKNTVDQRKRAVTFVFANRSSFDVSLETTCSKGQCSGRNFLFAGSSSLSFTCDEPMVLPGLCAAFGDPHFVTFDGAQTVLMANQPIWLVKSQEVWIQALSKDWDGKLAAIAVGGPFLGNKTLVVGKTSPGVVEAFFDGQKILGEAKDEFRVDGLLEGHRSTTWNATLHNNDVLAVRTQMKFSVGPWPERFAEPVGGLFLFRLPKNVELTLTGVDFMSVALTMPPQAGGQSGYCGDFNGDAADDFEPVGHSFHKPIGSDLEAVPDSELLFDPSVWGVGQGTQLLQKEADPAHVLDDCDAGVKAMAENKCKVVSDVNKREACVFDVCATGLMSAADAILAAEVLEEKVNSRGIPLLVGEGRCLDAAGQDYVAFTARKLKKAKGCKEVLRSLALMGGVMGAQLQEGSTCQILVEEGTDPTGVEIKGGWGPKSSVGSPGHGMVSSSTGEADWTCWQLL